MWSAAESLFARLGEFGPHIALAEGERTLTYAELLGAVAARGRHLRALGAHRVALALDNGIDWVLWDLAALHAGLVCVPVPAFFSADQQRHVLDSAGIDCLIGTRAPGFATVEADIHRRSVAQPAALHQNTCKITYTPAPPASPRACAWIWRRSWQWPTAWSRPASAAKYSGTCASCRWRPCWKTSPAFTRR